MSAEPNPAGTETADPASRYKGSPSPARLVEVARFFLKLGFVGFGGPLVHIAMMEDELVGERAGGGEGGGGHSGGGSEGGSGLGTSGWADESTFMDGLAICNMLPGPASTQLGIFMGWVRAGNPGALVAGATFMAPTFLIVVGLSYVYFAYGELPSVTAFFYGVNPVVIGLIAGAAYSMARSSLRTGEPHVSFSIGDDEWSVDYRLLALLLGALAATYVINPNPVLEFAVAGVVAVGLYQWGWVREHARRVSLAGAIAAIMLVAYGLRERLLGALGRTVSLPGAAGGLLAALWGNVWVKLILFMVYTGSFIFGGGLVLIPFIEKYVVVEFGWLTGKQFVDGIAIGQLTPGPVVMTTAFVGYALMLETYGSVGWAVLGAFVAMLAAFAPSFLFITVMFPYVARVRDDAVVSAALIGINAAVVGAIAGATISLSFGAIVDGFTAVLAVTSFVLFVRGVDAAYLIVGGGVLGAAVYLLL